MKSSDSGTADKEPPIVQMSEFSKKKNLRTLFPVGGRKLRKAVSKGGRQDK